MDKIEKLDQLLTEYVFILNSVLKDHAGQQPKDEYTIYLYNFIERFYYAVEAVLCILPKLKITFQYKYPLAILLRNIISDYLTVFYFLSFLKYQHNSDGSLKPIDGDFLEATHRIDRSFYRLLEKQLKIGVDTGDITAQQRLNTIHNYQKRAPAQFETNRNGEIGFKKRDEIKPGEIARFLKTTEFAHVAESYVYYAYYSQFEHISRISKDLLYSKFEMIDLKYLISTIRHLFGGTMVILANMRIDKSYEKKIIKLTEELMEAFPPEE